jgi:hypothetical protein
MCANSKIVLNFTCCIALAFALVEFVRGNLSSSHLFVEITVHKPVFWVDDMDRAACSLVSGWVNDCTSDSVNQVHIENVCKIFSCKNSPGSRIETHICETSRTLGWQWKLNWGWCIGTWHFCLPKHGPVSAPSQQDFCWQPRGSLCLLLPAAAAPTLGTPQVPWIRWMLIFASGY